MYPVLYQVYGSIRPRLYRSLRDNSKNEVVKMDYFLLQVLWLECQLHEYLVWPPKNMTPWLFFIFHVWPPVKFLFYNFILIPEKLGGGQTLDELIETEFGVVFSQDVCCLRVGCRGDYTVQPWTDWPTYKQNGNTISSAARGPGNVW